MTEKRSLRRETRKNKLALTGSATTDQALWRLADVLFDIAKTVGDLEHRTEEEPSDGEAASGN